jgi:hypothetical protein
MFFPEDKTQQYLVDYLNTTQDIMLAALKQYDNTASVNIVPTYDLGFPHDLIRIAGGFATGMFIDWKCSVPFIPVDTSVNVCSTTFFQVDNDISNRLTEKYFNEFRKKIEDGCSYLFNFHRGNHFIIFSKSVKSGKSYLILHSSASEFKKELNGLYPNNNNWYFKDIKTYFAKGRYLRYLIGNKAILFSRIAKQILEYNIIRHAFIGSLLLDDLCNIEAERTFHHYFMPTDHSVVIGGHLVKSGDNSPLLSSLGESIYMLKINNSNDRIAMGNDIYNLVPHGWGKESIVYPEIKIDCEKNTFSLNGVVDTIHIDSSLRGHPDLHIRNYATSIGIDKYFASIREQIDFDIVDTLSQIVSYTGKGYNRWC